jgi:hypothetical protein
MALSVQVCQGLVGWRVRLLPVYVRAPNQHIMSSRELAVIGRWVVTPLRHKSQLDLDM